MCSMFTIVCEIKTYLAGESGGEELQSVEERESVLESPFLEVAQLEVRRWSLEVRRSSLEQRWRPQDQFPECNAILCLTTLCEHHIQLINYSRQPLPIVPCRSW